MRTDKSVVNQLQSMYQQGTREEWTPMTDVSVLAPKIFTATCECGENWNICLKYRNQIAASH